MFLLSNEQNDFEHRTVASSLFSCLIMR